ncbi:hypothetical protein HBI56_062070 [Parastagonospora nodorum]|nr:hypothetical protein HBI09_082800 [Parastagonospora nodorum]KAH4105995.1 hypothetical protein HBH46_074850 [Parastagonospora nodorum]KAH4347450.1 hypothetical protein HBH98_093600 [Parastagonospora nodorum]KAH4388845.1 hypothetical protein HBH97_053790 [Parastagonospora nodorum]KAH4396672.1 hypothetical protein HBH99_121020 [Parastagonospora nodorum]
MSDKLKEDIRHVTHRKLVNLTGSAAGTEPCDDPYAISSLRTSQPEPTQFPAVDSLRPDLTPDAKRWVRERIQKQSLHLVFYRPYGTELAGEGFYATDSFEYNKAYEETLDSASDVHVQTLRDGDVKYTELAYELTYGISEEEKGKMVEWDNKARFTKNVIKRAEYRKQVPE